MATFGSTSNGGSSSTITDGIGDNKWVSSATPASSGTVVSMTHRAHVTAGSAAVRGIIYSDVAGVPTTLLAVTDDGSVVATSETALTLNFSGANLISITSGTPYWIGLHWQDPAGGDLVLSRDATANLRRTSDGTDTWTGGTASNFAGPVTLSGPVDTFVTYTEAAGPANMKTYNTNVKANSKTINTNLIANVKTVNTNV